MSQSETPASSRPGPIPSGGTVAGSPSPASSQASMFSAADALAIIARSHQRSTAYGLAADTPPDFTPIGGNDIALLIEQNRALHQYAMPVMETLYDQITNTHSMVVLTDAQGQIVHSLGDDDFMQKADRVALRPGVAWSEQSKGTNAIGTAIAEKVPVLVQASQHYLNANHFLVCSAAPIFDHEGEVIGVLDVSGEQHRHYSHTMALVRMSAQMIENQLFIASFPDAITLHFHSRPEFIGTLMEGIASFTPGGRFLSANRSGLFQLGLSLSALRTHTLHSLFGLPVSALFDHCRTAAPRLLNMCLHSGVRVYARTDLHFSNNMLHPAFDVVNEGDGWRQTATQHARAVPGLRDLDTGDQAMHAAIDKVRKVMGRDIPILITGETGTGKDQLAKAIHQDSPRAYAPFVAVNCAAIAENLIESELFGQEGCGGQDCIGRIRETNGGTLFLDHISDLPLSLQARLLCVLQERMITPGGSKRPFAVNVRVICSTHCNLRDCIAAGTFREDLYYHLNGLMVRLPALRERSDIAAIVHRVLSMEAGKKRPCTVSPEVMQLFRAHPWPGNLRQLANLLHIAMILAGEEREIGREHLPDDFLEDIGRPVLLQTGDTPPVRLHDMERSLIERALQVQGGNVSATAKLLGISRNTIYRKLKSH